MTSRLLQMKEISKSFSGVKALKHAHFDLIRGEVHALLGANGAGKSTLMKILSGAYTEDEGEIILDGKKLNDRTPKGAKEDGIYCVYQEVDTAIIPQLTVAENIMLDRIAGEKKLFISKREIDEQAKAALRPLNRENLALDQPAGRLTLAEKQLVLIARALIQQAKVIIFDEPTAPLSIEETKHLFMVIKNLRKQGVGCIFISHRLPEVFEIADRITVMRDGQTIQTFEKESTTQKQVVETMLGRRFEEEYPERKAVIGEELLQVSHLSDGNKVRDISFNLSRGEILGVVGLVGAGKTEMAKALFGAAEKTLGEVSLSGKPLRLRSSKEAIDSGMVLVPEERRKEGLFIQENVRTNLTFPSLKKFTQTFFVRNKAEQKHSETIIQKLGIKTRGTETSVVHLSGGNQQKVSIGKWLATNAEVFMFDEPTKGVDIGAKKDIFRIIHELVEEGKGVLYFSCETNEILGICDRILVVYDGRIVKELTREEATEEKILLYASGGKEEYSYEN
ncbi:MAG TPA: sugar ABC transporter ATP-binding protein [Chondromyces sp.]|nr:sugar ABC transporter ATP-binding protein [Chondromyces sp.]